MRCEEDKNSKPAIEGGKPVREKYLVFGEALLGAEEIEAVVKTLQSGWISTGPQSVEFAKQFKEYVGASFSVATNSCTSALHLALAACGVKRGDEVITTPMTFAATVNVIVHQGATPVFADIEKGWFNIDPEEIEKKITPRTKAIIPVHFAGLACDMDRIMTIAKKHGLYVIEDAAHAVGTEYKGRKIGSIADFTCFSFYVTKNMTTAEGGMITTNHEDMAKMISMMSLHGLDLDAWQRYSSRGFKHYEIAYPGYKYNMTDVAACLGIVQLRKLNEFIDIRKRYAQMYADAFKDMPEISVPKDNFEGRHAWHLYPIIINPGTVTLSRDSILEAIHHENIGVGVHYRAIHFQKYYRETFSFKRGDYPNAEYVSDNVLSLPLSPKMTEDDVADTILAVKKVISFYKAK